MMTLEEVRAEMMEREGKYRDWIDAIDAHLTSREVKGDGKTVACPECFRAALTDHDSVSCNACEKLWPLSQYESVKLETVRKRIEKAVIEHCAGGDLWLCSWLAAKDVAPSFTHPAAQEAVPHRLENKALDAMFQNRRDEDDLSKPDSAEFVLRAMTMNYTDRHVWDKLDADACLRGANEIKALRAELAAQEAAKPVVPDGLVLAPVEPTHDMYKVMASNFSSSVTFHRAYKAMIAAVQEENKP